MQEFLSNRELSHRDRLPFGHSLLSLAGRGRKTGNRGAWYTWAILPRKEDRECHARFHFHAGTIIIVPVCYATWHFRTPRLRRALDPACTRANYRKSDFFYFSLCLSLSLFLPFNQRGILTLFASCQGATFVIHAKTGSRGVGFYGARSGKAYLVESRVIRDWVW